jgi:RES domain-containing protein
MHTPRWATAPTSGAGAAAHGGRANRPGIPALYLALEPQTAIREYQQLSPLMPPGTLVSYTVQVAPVIDFRGGYDAARWPGLWEEFHCDWRELWFNQRVEPPSWVLADEALAAGAKGILFASTLAAGGSNLVVFNEHLTVADTLQVYDPVGALPKNLDSWR